VRCPQELACWSRYLGVAGVKCERPLADESF
jgi:hypothetical protein